MSASIRNVSTVDGRRTVSLPQRRQLAVYSRCVEPQPQRLGCRLNSLTVGTTRRLALVIRMRNHMRKLRQLLYSCLFRTLLRRLVPGANRVLTSASPLTNSMSPMSSIIRYVIDLMPDSGSITSISTLQYHRQLSLSIDVEYKSIASVGHYRANS